jgi:hypothetical protein
MEDNLHQDFVLYGKKTFGSLCNDIVKNSEDKKNTIEIMLSDLRVMIKTTQDAMMVVPLIQAYLEVGVRNDEQLIKLAAIVQRIIAGKGGDGEGSLLLTDEEKKQLMAGIDEIQKEMNTPVPEKTEEIAKIKKVKKES